MFKGSVETDMKKMPPPLTIPQHTTSSENTRNQPLHRHSKNSKGDINAIISQQKTTLHGIDTHTDEPNSLLSGRPTGNGRHSSSSFASAGIAVSDGNVILF